MLRLVNALKDSMMKLSIWSLLAPRPRLVRFPQGYL